MNTHVTIQQAVQETGKSVSTIRRVVKRLPTNAIRKEGDKYLIERAALLRELGLDSQNQMTTQDIQADTHPSQMNTQMGIHMDSQADIVAILTEQLRIKDEQIAQLLERQRETNILLNNMRLLTVKETVPAGKSAGESRRENIILIVSFTFLFVLFGLVVWFSWRGI